jgi:uncharacterized membrane protein YedE/YeeE
LATLATPTSGQSRRRGAVRVSALQLGIVAGLAAVVAGSLFEVRPPDAYGICMACHTRDLLDWTINRVAGTHLAIAPASLVYPLLTTVGVLLGAVLGSTTSGEFRWSTPDNSLKTFLYGAAVMVSALIGGGRSTGPDGIRRHGGRRDPGHTVAALEGHAMTAAIATLVIGVLIGYLGQRSRMCFVGGIRDFILVRDAYLLKGLIAFGLTAWIAFPLVGLVAGSRPGPYSASDWATILLTVLGGFGVGYFSTLANGCPFRQHVLAAQGITSSITYLAGFCLGAVIFHAWIERLLLRLLP